MCVNNFSQLETAVGLTPLSIFVLFFMHYFCLPIRVVDPHHGFNADSDPHPDLYLIADPDPVPGRQTNEDPCGSGSWSYFTVTDTDPHPDLYLTSDPDPAPGRQTNEDPCESGSWSYFTVTDTLCQKYCRS
jgi:hypothetical protein